MTERELDDAMETDLELETHRDLAEALNRLAEANADIAASMKDLAALLNSIEARLRRIREERADKLIETDQSHLWDTPG